MDKQVINVPEADALAQPRTRKDFFKSAAVAGVGAAAGAAALSPRAFAQSGGGDASVGNFALTLEYLETDFYNRALSAGVLSGEALAVVTDLRDDEAAHVDAIIKYLNNAGATPVAKPQFTFPDSAFASASAIFQTAIKLETTGVGAYLGAATMIQSPDLLAAAASIEVVEGEHVVTINDQLGVVPPANTAFPQALTKDQVLAAIAPFMGMGSMPDTGGIDPSKR